MVFHRSAVLVVVAAWWGWVSEGAAFKRRVGNKKYPTFVFVFGLSL